MLSRKRKYCHVNKVNLKIGDYKLPSNFQKKISICGNYVYIFSEQKLNVCHKRGVERRMKLVKQEKISENI